MKATIRKPNGDVIELDGTAEEIRQVATEPQWSFTVPWSVKNPWPPLNVPVNVPSFQIIDVCERQFPQPWMGVTAPACVLCGARGPAVGYTTCCDVDESVGFGTKICSLPPKS